MKNDIVIDLLKHGYENIQKGITKEGTVEYLFGLRKSFVSPSKKYKNLEDVKYTVNTYFDRNFFIPLDDEGNEIGNKYFLNPDGYFRFLQFKSIDVARKYSVLAIIIAIISILLSAFANKPVNISEKQMLSIIENDSALIRLNQDIGTSLQEIKIDISKFHGKIDTIKNITWKINNKKK